MLNVARVTLSCTPFPFAHSSITALPGVIFARNVRILQDYGWVEGSICQGVHTMLPDMLRLLPSNIPRGIAGLLLLERADRR